MRQPHDTPIKMKIDFVGESAGRDVVEGDLFRRKEKLPRARRVLYVVTAERCHQEAERV